MGAGVFQFTTPGSVMLAQAGTQFLKDANS
jgi:hypothetical protein